MTLHKIQECKAIAPRHKNCPAKQHGHGVIARWSSISKKLKYSITVFNNYKLINSPSPFSYRTFILLYLCFKEIRFLRFDFISCLQVCIGIECSYKRVSSLCTQLLSIGFKCLNVLCFATCFKSIISIALPIVNNHNFSFVYSLTFSLPPVCSIFYNMEFPVLVKFTFYHWIPRKMSTI